MLAIDKYRHIFRLQSTLHLFGDLHGQPLLYLGASGVVVHNPVDLRQTDHLATADVGYMRLSDKGQKVVLTKRVDSDVLLHQDIRSEEHTSELQSRGQIVCRLRLE